MKKHLIVAASIILATFSLSALADAPNLTLNITGLASSKFKINSSSDACSSYALETGSIKCHPSSGYAKAKLYLPTMLPQNAVSIKAPGVAFDKYGSLKIPYSLGEVALAFSDNGAELTITSKGDSGHHSGGGNPTPGKVLYVPYHPVQVNLRENYFNSGKDLKEKFTLTAANMHLVSTDGHTFLGSKTGIQGLALSCQGNSAICTSGSVNGGSQATGLLYVVAPNNAKGSSVFVRNDPGIVQAAQKQIIQAASQGVCQKLGAELYSCPSLINLQATLTKGQCSVVKGGGNCTQPIPAYFYWGLREKNIAALSAEAEQYAKTNNVALFSPEVFKSNGSGALDLPDPVKKVGLLNWFFDLGQAASLNQGKNIQLYFHSAANFSSEQDPLLKPHLTLPAVAQITASEEGNHVVDQASQAAQSTITLSDGTEFELTKQNGTWSVEMVKGDFSQAALYEINIDAVNTINHQVATTTFYIDANGGREAALNVMRGNSFYLYY